MQAGAICSSETSAETQRTTRCHIPRDDNLHIHRCENLKSYIVNTTQTWLLCPSICSRTKFHLSVTCPMIHVKTMLGRSKLSVRGRYEERKTTLKVEIWAIILVLTSQTMQLWNYERCDASESTLWSRHYARDLQSIILKLDTLHWMHGMLSSCQEETNICSDAKIIPSRES
jgi:hypothetical protein